MEPTQNLQPKFKVFVYGSLKRSFGNHWLLKDSKFLGAAKVPEGFVLHSLGPFPALQRVSHSTSPVYGELYEITDEVFSKLDRLEGYPNFYNRMEITVYDDSNEAHSAWTYFLTDSQLAGCSRGTVDSGTW